MNTSKKLLIMAIIKKLLLNLKIKIKIRKNLKEMASIIKLANNLLTNLIKKCLSYLNSTRTSMH